MPYIRQSRPHSEDPLRGNPASPGTDWERRNPQASGPNQTRRHRGRASPAARERRERCPLRKRSARPPPGAHACPLVPERPGRGAPPTREVDAATHVLSVSFIHRWQRGPSGHFTSLHFCTTRG